MSEVFWPTDEQWSRGAPLLPDDTRGMSRLDDRRVISGIVHVSKSGRRLADAPTICGPRKTIHNRFLPTVGPSCRRPMTFCRALPLICSCSVTRLTPSLPCTGRSKQRAQFQTSRSRPAALEKVAIAHGSIADATPLSLCSDGSRIFAASPHVTKKLSPTSHPQSFSPPLLPTGYEPGA